ncbi:MAG: hypothetical protein ACLSF7_11575, partial [Acutalibacteraceae bacterium]
SFSSFFSLSLHPSARCANDRDADLHAKGEERKNSYEENFDIPFVFKPLSAPINENQVKQKRSALLHFNYSVPLNYVLDITVSRRI